MDEKKVVSIRLNGKEKSYRECSKQESREASVGEAYSSLSELAASRDRDGENWIHEFRQKNEEQKQKKVIDFTARQREKRNLSLPFWDDGKRKRGPRMPPFGRRSKNFSGFSLNFIMHSVFLSILAAVLIGGAFGMLLLKVFTEQAPSTQSNNGEILHDHSDDIIPVTEQMAQLPNLELFVIQEGAYSTLMKAEEAASSLRHAQLPSLVYDDSELTFVFMGASPSRENADALANHYRNLGKEVYVKSFAVSGSHVNVAQEWTHFMEQGIAWINAAAPLSTKALESGNTDYSVLLAGIEEWKESLDVLKENPSKIESVALAEDWVAQAEHISQALEKNTITAQQAVDLQQTVLGSLATYEKLVLSLEAENN